jgi:hypothetical protein
MSKHIFETKMFAFAVFFCTVAALAASSFALYPKYQAEAELESYAPTLNAVKISEEIKVQRRSNKSSSWSEHIPCIRSVRLNCEQTQLVIVNGDSWCGRIGPQSA